MKKKAFTLVELLVVIAIIAMLLAILMPALNKVRQIAYRMVCGSNLSGIGKACLTYANDYQESYPVAGAAGCKLVTTKTNGTYVAWDGGGDTTAANPTFLNTGTVTMTNSMFLLIKYADVSSAQFVCKATDAKKFELTTQTGLQNTTTTKDITLCFDFGSATAVSGKGPWNYVSYGYQFPYTPSNTTNYVQNSVTASTPAGVAIFADQGSWYKEWQVVTANTDLNTNIGPFRPTDVQLGLSGSTPANKSVIQKTNSANHQQEGQNVLFGDSHVSFENKPTVGIEEDNIYTPWNGAPTATQTAYDKQGGAASMPAYGSFGSVNNPNDSFLVN